MTSPNEIYVSSYFLETIVGYIIEQNKQLLKVISEDERIPFFNLCEQFIPLREDILREIQKRGTSSSESSESLSSSSLVE